MTAPVRFIFLSQFWPDQPMPRPILPFSVALVNAGFLTAVNAINDKYLWVIKAGGNKQTCLGQVNIEFLYL